MKKAEVKAAAEKLDDKELAKEVSRWTQLASRWQELRYSRAAEEQDVLDAQMKLQAAVECLDVAKLTKPRAVEVTKVLEEQLKELRKMRRQLRASVLTAEREADKVLEKVKVLREVVASRKEEV